MAANNGGSDSTGKKFYYSVSYGMLSTNAKEAPEGFEETTLSEIKSKRQKNENVDLRRKYYDTKNGKDYPLRVFYTDIDGFIEAVEKDKFDKGTSLKITLHDSDGDESVIQTDFYGKVCADFLNRLLNVNPENQLNFRPYSIPSSFEGDKGTINFFNAGVSIKDNGTKIERAFKKDNGLPATKQVQNAKGEMETSRVEQINFLWEKVEAKFANLASSSTRETTQPKQEQQTEAPAVETAPATSQPMTTTIPNDDLPF